MSEPDRELNRALLEVCAACEPLTPLLAGIAGRCGMRWLIVDPAGGELSGLSLTPRAAWLDAARRVRGEAKA